VGLTSGSRLGAYEIQSPLGAGGMGEVYRATDTKLGRDVALKVLPAEMALDPERLARFRREARAVAALNHPNVVTLYSVEEHDGIHFITMELVEGVSLDRRIASGGMPVEQIVEIAGALAEALSAAHEKGIVHRDLKPANVMVTNEGRVKVLDFGLAKDVSAETSDGATLTSAGHTQAGIVMGTPAYMSPEQVAGRPLDHRTDIFSLGVVLHELSTGQRPFAGSSSAELVSAILRDTPPLVTDVRSELPTDLARVIRRCLEKDPRYRVQTARDVSNEFRDLSRLASRPVASVSTSTSRAPVAPDSGSARADEGFWVAVLPFKYSGNNSDATALAEGLTDDIITGLSKFSYLRVIARSSTARYAQQAVDVRSAAKELGARYVMEGSVRQAGAKVRIAVQLVDANTGAGLWAEMYDRAFTAESTLDLLDDVVPRIVATVGDTQGILPHSMTESLRGRDPESLTPYEALLRSFGFHQHVSAEEHLAGRTALEHAVKQAPDRADCWAMLAWLYRGEYTHEYNARPDPMDRALAAARRAVSLEPSNQLAQASLASVFFFRHEFGPFRAAAERALALNQMEGYTTAFLGQHFACSGDWERGIALTERAIQLNPNHPGWYWLTLVYDAYRQGDGQRALEFVLKVNMPQLWTAQLMLAVVHSNVDQMDQARIALRELIALRPPFRTTPRAELEKWWLPDLIEMMLSDLRKAGLETSEEKNDSGAVKTSATALPAKTVSGETRTEEGFWVAVLPFRYKGSDDALHALADGLTEEIITGLSRFSYLRVIARGSTGKFSRESGDVRSIGKEVGARYVLEGSIRQAGSAIRLAAQLVDATTGAHLWAETFERPFRSDQIFSLQDQLVPRIVSTIADQAGILPRSICAAVRKKSDAHVTPYEAVFRVFSFHQSMTSQEHTACRELLERIVRDAPDSADCWAVLSTLYGDEDWLGFNPLPDSLGRQAAAAQRAADLSPASSLAGHALAQSLFQRREWQSFRSMAERTITLNPMEGSTLAFMGILLACSGEWERGCAVTDSAMQLNPHFPGWFWLATVLNAYRTRDYRAALDAALRMQMPSFLWTPVTRAAAYGQLGEWVGAQKELRELLAMVPNFTATARQALEKWLDPELAEHLLDGLRKAGLETTAAVAATPASGTATRGTDSGATRADEGFWVAVLPFKHAGNADVAEMAEGLTEDVVTGLSRFSYLRVVARSSTARYAKEAVDVRASAKELGARYVMEGSVRQAGARVRIAVQLVDAVSGTSVWAETYDRAFQPDAMLDLLDELVRRIVSTVADQHGILPRSISAAVRKKSDDQLSPYEAVFRVFGLHEKMTAQEHSACRDLLERVVRDAPDAADCWAMLATLYADEEWFGFNLKPDPLGRAEAAAQRAIALAPTSSLATLAQAQSLFQRHEWQAFRPVAERTIALNPMDGATVAVVGLLLACTGQWDEGCAAAESAMRLHPNFPGWYWLASIFNAYRKKDYRAAVDGALRIQIPGYYWTSVVLAAANAQLGEKDPAQKAFRELLAARPNFAATARQDLLKWFDAELADQFVEGLNKAGLTNASSTGAAALSSDAVPVRTASGATRAEEGFWVAALPFKYSGNNPDLKSLADGLSEDVTTGLSRFSYLRVIARGSTAKYSSESGDVRAIGKELGARYVMEGSLRQAGNKLRLAVQLADTVSGAHLWAETYERIFSPESIFELQDELVPRIVSTVADQYGVLPHSISELLRQRKEATFAPHEAVLRAFSYFERLTPEEHAEVRPILEKATAEAPGLSDGWAMLSIAYWHEYALGLNPLPDSLARAHAAARRAVEAAPSNHVAHQCLAAALFFQKDILGFRRAAERCMELNPMDGSTLALMGTLLSYAGDWERGCAIVERAGQMNPNHPGWYHFPPFLNAYQKGDYTTALKFAVKIDMPGYDFSFAARAAVLAQLGQVERARDQVRQLLALRPDFATVGRNELNKWYPPDLVEHWIDGLRKAGLAVPERDKASPSGPVPAAPSIAVLPFANMSDDKGQDYFSDGLAEEIINLLAQVPGLKVIARTSAFAFRGKEQDIRGIAETLGVSTVLEGSVRRWGSRIRVTAQLINATDGSHLWSERYDRELSDIFAVQDEISAAIAKALRVKLSREGATQRYTPKIEAYEAYLKGRQQQGKVTPESLELARRYYAQAIELDPAFGMAHIGLAFYWMTVAHFGQNSVDESVSEARAEVQRALQIDASLADGHALLGYLAALFDSDWAAAEKHFEFPQAKQASFELVKPMYGGFLYLRGNADQAIELAERAIEEDPLDVWAHMNLHAYLQPAGRADEALEQLKKVVELDPNQVVALASMVMIYADKGDIAEALKIARRAYAVGRWFTDTAALLAALLRRNGDEEESKSIQRELGSGAAVGDARAHALFHLICGEIDQGADWAEKAIAERDSSMRFYLGFVICKRLRASNRWPKIAKMVNLPA